MSQVVRKIIHTTKAPGSIGPFSQAVQVDKTLYLCGQVGVDPATMKLVGDDIESQTKQALLNMGQILGAANSSYSNVVKANVYLADMNDFAAMNKVYTSFFKPPYPARTALQVANLPMSAKVEIEAIAVVGDVKDE